MTTSTAAPADRFFVARSAGRYRVFDRLADGTEVEVAVVASRAKGEEKVAKLIAAADAELNEAYAAKVATEDEARRRAAQDEFDASQADLARKHRAAELAEAVNAGRVSFDDAAAELLAAGPMQRLDPVAAAKSRPAVSAARPAERAAERAKIAADDTLVSVRVGQRIADGVFTADGLHAGESLRTKLEAKAPNGDGVRVVRLNGVERATLAKIATEVEAQARTWVSEGDRRAVSLVFSAQQLQKQLAAV